MDCRNTFNAFDYAHINQTPLTNIRIVSPANHENIFGFAASGTIDADGTIKVFNPKYWPNYILPNQNYVILANELPGGVYGRPREISSNLIIFKPR